MMIIFLVLALSATCIAADYMKYCGSEECDPNYQPVPNIFTAMTGYNILKGNPMPEAGNQLKDPGFTGLSYLFVPTVKNSQDRYTLDDGLTVRELRNFASSLESEVIRNTKEYQKSLKTAASHEQDFATNLEYDVSATLPVGPAEVGVQTTVPPMAAAAFGSNSGFRKNERFFTEEEGILVFAKAKLISYTLTVSKTKPPRFHPGFIAMLSELQEAGNGDNREKDAKLKKLIDNFGTHYLRNVDMGARIAITKRYDRKEAMKTTQEEIQQCTKSSLNIFFGLVNTASSKCKTTIESRHSRWTRTYKRKFITSFGSKPNHDLMAWANQKIDKPVPIQMTLEPIVNLFTKTFMGNMTNCNDGLGVEIDYKSILKWMLPKYLSYCEEHKRELHMSTCDIQNVEAKGCGLSDDCEFDQICKNDRNNPKGYYCEDQKRNYKITVRTSDITDADTNARVYITLYDIKGRSTQEFQLDDEDRNDFERGNEDEFDFNPGKVMGELNKIKIRHDNSGSAPGWHLDWVEVIDLVTKRHFKFNCEKWLKNRKISTECTVE